MATETVNTEELLDQIFGDPEVAHGLQLFDKAALAKLPLSVGEDGRPRIKCRVTERLRIAKPEEIIRQLELNHLIDDLGYELDRIAIEVKVKMGAAYASKAADIVVYTDSTKVSAYIIVEVKKPKRKDGLDQLHSYMNATGVSYGSWLNGNLEAPQLRLDPNLFEEIPRLPAADEDLEDVKTPLTRGELQPVEDFKEEIEYLEDTVLANAGVSAFEEIFKLIFAKLYDEFDKADNEAVDFRTTTAPPAEQYKRINGLFQAAAKEWPDIFVPTDRIELSPPALVAVASAFQTKRLLNADLDVIDAAFEYMINPEQKGDKGQYFTPRPVVKMAVQMMNPQPGDHVLDPACGPGGFLIHALNWVVATYLVPRFDKKQLPKKRSDYAIARLYGIDFDPRLARVAKAMMLIVGDGRTNIFRVNALDEREWVGRSDGLEGAIRDGLSDVLLTNPPFAGSITQPEILGHFDLAYKGDPTSHKRSASMTRDVLFIERSLRFLRPGGRMGIVLPQGNFNNVNAAFVRDWVRARTRILAVVGLHPNTFKPFTNTKTSLLFVQKLEEGEDPESDYPVFQAVNQVPLKDSSGRYLYRRRPDGSFETDEHGHRIVSHDFDEIATAFREFAKEQRLSFWTD